MDDDRFCSLYLNFGKLVAFYKAQGCREGIYKIEMCTDLVYNVTGEASKTC